MPARQEAAHSLLLLIFPLLSERVNAPRRSFSRFTPEITQFTQGAGEEGGEKELSVA